MSTDHVQTKQEIAATLKQAGLRPRKSFGQNFLIDGNLMRRLVDAAEIAPGDFVLEVGAGTGGLTDLLVERSDKLMSVELDKRLFELLEDRYHDRTGVTLVSGDILASKHRLHDTVSKALRAFVATADCGIKLVANLPYQIATPLVMNLILDYPSVRRLCFTVQREVGARMEAVPHTKAYGPLSIISQLLCEVKTIAKLPPGVFWPRPAVESVMLQMDTKPPPFDCQEDLKSFAAFVRDMFDHRRKTIRSVLRNAVSDDARDRVCAEFAPQRRPESFDVPEWLTMHRLVTEAGS